METWICFTDSTERNSHYPMRPLRAALTARCESVQADSRLGDWQAITIKFSGEILPRDREAVFKGAMFSAYPGDLVFSKIDARNGAIGLIPDSIPKAVVTNEYPVFIPDAGKLRALYLYHLLRCEHFKTELQHKASGTTGRKRVTAESFLRLEIPVPSLDEQDALLTTYTATLDRACEWEREADRIERTAWQAFEAGLGLAPPVPLPDRPVFIARFKDVDRWSHESILRNATGIVEPPSAWPLVRLGDVVAGLENGWSPQCHPHPAREGAWGVVKTSAVSSGRFKPEENKELPAHLNPRPALEIVPGDVLIGSANVARYVGICVHVEQTPPQLLLCGKLFRVRFDPGGTLLPRFLPEVMRLRLVREHIESHLSGTSPSMKNITQPALLDTCFPLPDLETQQCLVDALHAARADAAALRTEAGRLRRSARSDFEAAVFTA